MHLIRAAMWAGRRGWFWNVRIVGEGPEYKNIMQAWGGDEYCNLTIYPRMTRILLTQFMRDADVFVLPSITDDRGLTEGLGLVALEAIMEGTPVVAYDTGGVGDIIEHGLTGLLVPEGDFVGLANAIKVALGQAINPEIARGVCLERFDEGTIALRTRNAILSIIS